MSDRRDGDTWDLASGVGATATAVATSRALATREGIIDDRWAEPLVRAVGNEHFVGILDAGARQDGGQDDAQDGQRRMTLGMAARTRYFDDFLATATAKGIRQVVILAAGLDARGYRLDWPAGTVVFDLDQPGVVDFKAAALAELGAQPAATVRNIGVDLRDDWPTALRANGFDDDAATAWIAEGLLMYLPADAQDRLFDHITALSPAGSVLATEFVPNMDAFTGGQWRQMGFKDDLAGLIYPGERSHVIDYLENLGWQVSGTLAQELFDSYGIEAPGEPGDEIDERFEGFQYLAATLATKAPAAALAPPRTDDDTWDLASSVGATATMVAAARAMATRDPRGLIDDPFAAPLVRAVGIPFFTDLLDGRLDASALGDTGPQRLEAMVAGMAMRTRFFDEYFGRETARGIRQVVILAAGLDSRGYRLTWPPDAVVYEVDQPAVVEFKTRTLTALGATPAATRRTVGIDLRQDWPAALRAAGFDPSAPTAWLAEGLLIYLPPEAQDRLLDTITAMSAPGSAIATEAVPGLADFDTGRVREMSATLRQRGLNLDMAGLIYPGPRSNVLDYLTAGGWQVTGVGGDDLLAANGLAAPDRTDPDAFDPLGEIIYVSATRG